MHRLPSAWIGKVDVLETYRRGQSLSHRCRDWHFDQRLIRKDIKDLLRGGK